MVAAWIVRRYIASVTCVAILIVAIFIAATWAQFQALRRQHQWPIQERLMTMHDQRAIAFSTMHDARTVQRSNRASGMLKYTIRVRCVYLCGDIFVVPQPVAQARERYCVQYWMPWSMTVTSLSPWQTFLSLDSTGKNRIFFSRAMPSPNWPHRASHGAAAAGYLECAGHGSDHVWAGPGRRAWAIHGHGGPL